MNLTDESEREYWQEELNICFGMSKEDAFENFRQWREGKKTCQRCEGEKYVESCPIKNICKEADNERTDVVGNGNRSRNVEAVEHKALRTNEFEARKRASIR